MDIQILESCEQREHMHMDAELLYVLEGNIKVSVNDRIYSLENGDVILINSNNRHSYAVQGTTLVCRIFLTYHELLDNLQKDFALFWCNSSVTSSAGYMELGGILDEIIDAWVVSVKNTYVKKSLYYKLLGCLDENFLITEYSEDVGGISNFRKDAMMQYINANYPRTLTLKDMASRMFMTESAFSKYFHRTVGISFVKYVNNIRLHHAVEDLLSTDKPVTRIAMDNGFPNPSLFNKYFKALYQMTPTQFRESTKPEKRSMPPKRPASDPARVRQYLEVKRSDCESELQERFISVDVLDSHPYNNGWISAMNLGAAPELLSARLQQQIERAGRELGFKYGRIWNIFSWNMRLRENHEVRELKFDYVDDVLDFLVDHEIIPFIDLGDKVSLAYKNCGDELYREEKRKLFQSVEEYQEVLDTFMRHIVHRYGQDAVDQWIFELWFDTGDMVQGLVTVQADYDYTEVFKKSSKIIKGWAPGAAVGGAGLRTGNLHYPLRKFLAEAGQMEEQPDFISIYCYPYCWIDENDVLGSIICSHTEFIDKEIKGYKEMAAQYGLEHIPMYITEWNMSLSERNYYNDSCGKAALMLKNMVDHLEGAAMAIYRSVSDLGADYFDSNRLLFGGGGLFNKEGIAKPSFYAMQFLSRMYHLLVETGDGYMVTADGNGSYAILCFNYKVIGQDYYLKPESDVRIERLESIYADNLPLIFHLSLKNVKDGNYRVRRYRITNVYGSILNVWEQLDRDPALREDVEYMRRICVPRMEISHQAVREGQLALDERLEAHEIRLIYVSV